MLPLIPGSASPCSNADILGHFNPLAWNVSNSPLPGVGSVDQYEVGDISGKFGMLTGRTSFDAVYEDPSMPLTGPYSIVGRSLVIHHTNSTRLRCADIIANTSTGGQLITSKAVFNGSVAGTVQLRQQMFADGSYSDVTLDVNLQASTRANLLQASLFVGSNRMNGTLCDSVGGTFNPFNMPPKSSSCSLENSLSCVVGEISARQGNVSLTQRQVFSDSVIQLSGDNTVVHRSLVLKDGDTIVACADILPDSPSSEQTFPNVTNFSRFDFRRRVADVLQLETARVTILPGSPFTVQGSDCLRVNYMVSGEVSAEQLSSVKTSAAMGVFKESDVCTKSTGGAGLLLPGRLLLALMFSVAFLLPSTA
ncbi:Cell surface superoxide dismutase [Cu-Zn] 6 [Oryzias melastigma]|uniref:Cell surface superoxide dismutase [Cu-Zn] 6 n=1 Tax=Oryzias melastigma TaxID=30732 RepID=A0A834FAJ9_ORYME|nr:Cell surface superoxide dismutase [Cu-Zn] 6 [Oryzias melastigma]